MDYTARSVAKDGAKKMSVNPAVMEANMQIMQALPIIAPIIVMLIIILYILYVCYPMAKCEHEYNPNYCIKCGEKKNE